MNKTGKYQKSTFAKNLISRRKGLGLSAEEFAEFADIKYPTLRDIEHGSSSGSAKTKAKIAEALKTTVDELNTPRPEGPTSITGSKTEILGRLMEVLPSMHESQLRFLLDGIEQMHDPLVEALVQKHTKGKGQQTGGA